MSIVVDLPAPFGPSRATVSPAAIETSMPRTACTGPCGDRKDFVKPSIWMPAAAVASVVVILRESAKPVSLPTTDETQPRRFRHRTGLDP
jgi:hypothetical protein